MKKISILLLSILIFSSCRTALQFSGKGKDSAPLSVTFLQINDFYEIAPVDQGNSGGAARIASLRKKLLAENSNTYTLLAGDFLSPSLIGTLKVDGDRVKGRQMVEALNLAGLDLAAFGNHEFDIDEAALQKRINESDFDWVATNVLQKNAGGSAAFFKEKNGIKQAIPRHKIIRIGNQKGDSLRIGIISPCINSNKASYVVYEDPVRTTGEEIAKIKGQVELIVLLSHLTKEEDLDLARKFPEIRLIMGGHEHDHMKLTAGNAVLTKADANARSAFVHKITYDPRRKQSSIGSDLVFLDKTIPLDSEVSALVQKWKAIENRIMREMGFDPDEVLQTLGSSLDAREQTIRNVPAPFCQMICRAMSRSSDGIDCSIMNSGSVRVDDEFKGSLSQYDIIRSLPYGGSVVKVKMKGKLLLEVLDAGWKNKGRGGFLQWDRIDRTQDNRWTLAGAPVDPQKVYSVCLTEYLIKGLEQGLDFLKPTNPDILAVEEPDPKNERDLRRDIRLVVVDYLKKGGR